MFWDMFREKGTTTYQTTVDYYAESIEEYEGSVYFRGDALEELAQKIGIPEEAFLATVERYNELCAANYDEDFHKSVQFPYPIGNVSGDIHAVDCPINVPGNSHGRALTQGYLIGRMLAGQA